MKIYNVIKKWLNFTLLKLLLRLKLKYLKSLENSIGKKKKKGKKEKEKWWNLKFDYFCVLYFNVLILVEEVNRFEFKCGISF